MAKNNKGRVPIQNPTQKTTDSQNYTGTDPLIGWFKLAKPLQNRQQKREFKKGWRKW